SREIKEERIPYLTLFLLGALVCLTRRNGSYLVLPSFLLLAFYLVGKRRLIGGLLVVATVGLLWGNGRLGDALGVERASMRVYYSVLFQQTARFYREYPEEVKKKEKKAVKGVLSGKKLGELYNPELSDPVKNTFREDASKKAMKKYLKAYLAMGKRHPLVYVDAFLEGCYGYYYPFRLSEVSSPWYLDRGESYSKKLALSLHHLFPVWVRRVSSVFAYAFRKVPVLKVIVTPGFYTWAYLVLAGFLIKRKKAYALWPFILPLMLLGVCTLCPVNGAVRYFLPLMGSFPACLAYVLTCPASGDQKK
ncbi:MAG: hypothetical protein IIY58_00835, partial [Aeriscardovia sp.]|nr:hypothetical protein [Aeriscardovia sp.]